MGKPYTDDLRERAVAAMVGGMSCREAGAIYGVAPSIAGNWYRQYQRTNSSITRPTSIAAINPTIRYSLSRSASRWTRALCGAPWA
jgi:transposase-like protein